MGMTAVNEDFPRQVVLHLGTTCSEQPHIPTPECPSQKFQVQPETEVLTMGSPFQPGIREVNWPVKPYSPAPCVHMDDPLRSPGVGKVCDTSLLVSEIRVQ